MTNQGAKALLAVLVYVVANALGGNAYAKTVLHVGGSNFPFYRVDSCEPSGRHGVVRDYDVAREIINRQLNQMYAAGQRRIRLPIYFGHGLNDTVNISSNVDGSEGYLTNIAALLGALNRFHFEAIEISFHPQGQNLPYTWSSWNEGAYQEHWQLILKIRAVVKQSHLPYLLDLMNEGIPTPNQKLLMQYAQRLWIDYTRKFGKVDTVGFSVIPSAERVEAIAEVYGRNFPLELELHPYANAQAVLTEAERILSGVGLGRTPWIIGESYYNDRQEALEVQAVLRTIHVKVLYLLQWPLKRTANCSDLVSFPKDFSAYRVNGF